MRGIGPPNRGTFLVSSRSNGLHLAAAKVMGLRPYSEDLGDISVQSLKLWHLGSSDFADSKIMGRRLAALTTASSFLSRCPRGKGYLRC